MHLFFFFFFFSTNERTTNDEKTPENPKPFPGDRSMTTRESFLLSLFLFFFFFFESADFGWCEKENRFNALLLVCVVGDVPFSLNGWLVGWLEKSHSLSLERESSDTHTRADAECSDSPRRRREFLRFLRC